MPGCTHYPGTDINGHDYRFAADVTNHRVFICGGDEVLEVHDLAVLAEEGVLSPTVQDGELYAADSPRVRVEA